MAAYFYVYFLLSVVSADIDLSICDQLFNVGTVSFKNLNLRLFLTKNREGWFIFWRVSWPDGSCFAMCRRRFHDRHVKTVGLVDAEWRIRGENMTVVNNVYHCSFFWQKQESILFQLRSVASSTRLNALVLLFFKFLFVTVPMVVIFLSDLFRPWKGLK